MFKNKKKKSQKPIQTAAKAAQQEEKVKGSAPEAVQTQISQRQGQGQPLPTPLKMDMETRSGASFEGVNIHTDGQAADMAEELGAKAFTSGNDIFFNSGHYNPGTTSGQSLIEHELNHVLQQRSGEAAGVASSNAAYDAMEAKADRPIEQHASTQGGGSNDIITQREAEGVEEEEEVIQEKGLQREEQEEAVKEKKLESIGLHPEEAEAPYAHVSEVDDHVLQAGAGMLKKDFGDGAHMDVLNGDTELGVLGELGTDARLGAKASAQMFRGSTPQSESVSFDGSVFSASAEMSAGEDGATVSYGASLIEGAAQVGNLASEEVNDEQARFGLSAGVGLGGRLHYGDKDHDGRRELGFGADFGMFSFDIKSEDPALTVLKSNPLAAPLAWGLDFATDDKSFNLTDSLIDLVMPSGENTVEEKPVEEGQEIVEEEVFESDQGGPATEQISSNSELFDIKPRPYYYWVRKHEPSLFSEINHKIDQQLFSWMKENGQRPRKLTKQDVAQKTEPYLMWQTIRDEVVGEMIASGDISEKYIESLQIDDPQE